ncbi:uncharacterized protein LOC129757852 isoform X2 [Uranotaenia lowii]|uniref:uncharacterized protein LOC129757852 isoform X2 n=1 Tax=Uranotaenia lowii TaxID=190385 RepID=UPI002479FD48|nr:uncharacterized protein LOC129757852 isoform X2 [Uranotaenia lowii]
MDSYIFNEKTFKIDCFNFCTSSDNLNNCNFSAQKFNNTSLRLATEDRLKNMGLKEGPILLVLDIIGKTKAKNSTCTEQLNTENISEIRIKLEKHAKFAQQVLYAKLDKQLPLLRKEMCEMVRILCWRWKNRVISKDYPKTVELEEMARKIIQEFPYLQNYAENSEMAFFSRNSGKGRGQPHSEEVVSIAINLAVMEGMPENITYIKEDMVKCLPLLQNLIVRKKKPKSISETLPHLLGFGGEIIVDMFSIMNPSYNKHANLNSVCAKGLLFKPTSFGRVKDGNLRGALRIWLTLNCQGINRKIYDGDIEEQLAQAFITWTGEDAMATLEMLGRYEAIFLTTGKYPPAQILCQAKPFDVGNYTIYLNGITIKPSFRSPRFYLNADHQKLWFGSYLSYQLQLYVEVFFSTTNKTQTQKTQTNLEKYNKTKCAKYWPENINDSTQYGELGNAFTSDSYYADYIVRNLKVTKRSINSAGEDVEDNRYIS